MSVSPVRGFYCHPSSPLKQIGVNLRRVDELWTRSEQMDMRRDIYSFKRSEVNALVPSCEKGVTNELVAVVGPWVDDLDGCEVISDAAFHPAKKAEAKRRLVIVRIESPE